MGERKFTYDLKQHFFQFAASRRYRIIRISGNFSTHFFLGTRRLKEKSDPKNHYRFLHYIHKNFDCWGVGRAIFTFVADLPVALRVPMRGAPSPEARSAIPYNAS